LFILAVAGSVSDELLLAGAQEPVRHLESMVLIIVLKILGFSSLDFLTLSTALWNISWISAGVY
jgi:hypothetical protein